MAHHHYDVADSPDEHGIQQVWKRHRETLRFCRLICNWPTTYGDQGDRPRGSRKASR